MKEAKRHTFTLEAIGKMKRVLFTILVMLIFRDITRSQAGDSAYYFKCIDNKTKEAMPFAFIHIFSNGVRISGGTTDINGVAKIPWKQIGPGIKVNAKALYAGYKAKEIQGIKPRINDTILFRLDENGIQLNEIEIISYRVPLIDPDTKPKKKWRQKKKKIITVVDTAICYTREELQVYKLIVEGKWFNDDSLSNKYTNDLAIWLQALQRRIKYPERALEWGIQEKLYFSFKVNEKGETADVKLRRGKEAILVLEVAKYLRGMPRFVWRNHYNETKNIQSAEYFLPLNFKLR